MKVALFSDVHGNITGARAVLALLDELGGADVVYAAGDTIGGSGGGEDLLDLLLDRGVRLLRGNAEEAALDVEASQRDIPEHWRAYSRESAAWLRANISQPYWDMIAALPLSETVEADGRRLLVCHASPRSPWDRVCSPHAALADLRAAYGDVDADVIAYGHWHAHHVLPLDAKLLVNVASVGLRTDGMSALTLVELTEDRRIIRQFTTPYDVEEEARLSTERGVPQP